MNKKEEVLVEMYKRSLDTVMVHNTTESDFVLVYDKAMTNTKYLVPHRLKDLGHGKGNMMMPRYLAEMYVEKMIVQLISKKAEDLWEKEKTKYRIEERSKFEEKYALRTNNKELWAEYYPKLWLGVVQKYGGDDIQEPESSRPVSNKNLTQDLQNELGLADKEYQAMVDDAKARLVKGISES